MDLPVSTYTRDALFAPSVSHSLAEGFRRAPREVLAIGHDVPFDDEASTPSFSGYADTPFSIWTMDKETGLARITEARIDMADMVEPLSTAAIFTRWDEGPREAITRAMQAADGEEATWEYRFWQAIFLADGLIVMPWIDISAPSLLFSNGGSPCPDAVKNRSAALIHLFHDRGLSAHGRVALAARIGRFLSACLAVDLSRLAIADPAFRDARFTLSAMEAA